MFHDDDDDVGYRKPPKANRFKKGTSGNPNGRPKSQEEKIFYELLMEALDEPVQMKLGGEICEVSAKKALMMSLVSHAIKNPKYFPIIMDMISKNEKVLTL